MKKSVLATYYCKECMHADCYMLLDGPCHLDNSVNLHRRYFIGWLKPLEYANFYSKLDFRALIRLRFNPLNIQGGM